jgi:hypothetical protein
VRSRRREEKGRGTPTVGPSPRFLTARLKPLDAAGRRWFLIPALGYVILTVFAIAAARTAVREADVVGAPSPH